MSRFVSIAEARAAGGLRLAGLRGIPSPWTEAAKGIFHVKGLDCVLAAQSETDEPHAIAAWAGDSSVPVVAWEKEALRTGWAEILLLAERLAPAVRLIPEDPRTRAEMFGLAHEICGEMGLGWCLRLEMLRAGMAHGEGSGEGFPASVSARLAARYGFHPADVRQARARVLDILALLHATLGGKRYFLGDSLSALDVYWATFANLIRPLPEAQLPMLPFMRGIYTCKDEGIQAAFSDRLAAHQRTVYERHLELPVPL
ncbi:MAG: hypothetical protein R3E82_00825 [Pseudomonadales bacterium]|nr:hypothetical protein [Pseudomonadales bacterium]